MKKRIHCLAILLFLLFQIQIQADDLTEKKIIEEAVDRYFSTWSNMDMEGYESCFAWNSGRGDVC